ncbi:MAG: hypothetical protein LBH29_03240 [Elusimicrobiota bacterium]|jgi:hypothetical protein|nr:hypothetical protein [Elusimicrobiota bacterium]
MKRVLLLVGLLFIVAGCSKNNSDAPATAETYYLTTEFDTTPARSPDGYLYASEFAYRLKATLLNSKGQIVDSALTWKWRNAMTRSPDGYWYNAFSGWQPTNEGSGMERTSQSNQYLELRMNAEMPAGQLGDAVITIKSDSKGVEITTNVRAIQEQ